MAPSPERRRYYPEAENVPLSVAVREAVAAHESASLSADEFDLSDHVDPEALDALFEAEADVDVSVQIRLHDVTVSVWTDDGVDIRVTDRIG
ncbi:HalOD1 output domain-containing protein [Halosimplex salinum]|uniref:HalOD1 output domain-containing protein n=1 Tax=Halosimplex salinum TaxID=1710538 RepID=UPI000F47E4C1|nr:HalOD1 output domain-containing protein [Halosimplex salinum]